MLNVVVAVVAIVDMYKTRTMCSAVFFLLFLSVRNCELVEEDECIGRNNLSIPLLERGKRFMISEGERTSEGIVKGTKVRSHIR